MEFKTRECENAGFSFSDGQKTLWQTLDPSQSVFKMVADRVDFCCLWVRHCKYLFIDFVCVFIDCVWIWLISDRCKTGRTTSLLVENFPHPTLLRSASFPVWESGACGLRPRFPGSPYSPGMSEPITPSCFHGRRHLEFLIGLLIHYLVLMRCYVRSSWMKSGLLIVRERLRG